MSKPPDQDSDNKCNQCEEFTRQAIQAPVGDKFEMQYLYQTIRDKFDIQYRSHNW